MSEHFCSQHNTVFFKKGNMRGYAHPVKDAEGKTLSWCSEDAQKVAELPPQEPKILLEHEKIIEKAKAEVRYDPTRKSIERQTALKAAVEISVAQVQAGKEMKVVQILTIASLFESYLENGIIVKEG